MIRLIVPCLLGISVWLSPLNVSAQDAPTPAVPTIFRQAPPAIYVENSQGKHFLMPGWPFTELDEIFRKLTSEDQQDAIPSFIPRSVSATGTAKDNYVELDVQIELQTFSDQPVRIPLGFKEGILPSKDQTDKPSFRYTGIGSANITVEEGQYVALVVPQTQPVAKSEDSDKSEKPDTDQQHTLSLLLWIPFTKSGSGEHRFALSFPQFTSTQLLLEVPMTNINASVSRGILHDKQEQTERQSTLLNIQGLRSDIEISWEKKKAEIVDDRPVLRVEDAVMEVRLNAHSTAYDVVLPVSSATGNFEQLQIRLPKGFMLDREVIDKHAAENDYSVGEVDDESVVTIQFPQKTIGPVALHLVGKQFFEGERPDFKRDLEGFEVIGAERQTGTLSASVYPADMKPLWEPVRGVRHPEGGSPSTGLSTASAFAGETRFEFISQPFLLRVQMRTQQTRISVKPEYQFHIRKGGISMAARLVYTVSGAKTNVLHLLLPDEQWRCDFGTSSLVDTSNGKPDESGLLTIPLRNPMDATFEIEFQARRLLEFEDEQIHRLVLPMPEPQVDWSEPALVTIVSDKNVEVSPVYESYTTSSKQYTTGLTRQTRRPAVASLRLELTDLQQEPLYFRTEPTNAVFVADLSYQQQRVNAAIQTDVQLFEDYNQVTQTISYDAAYAPVTRVYVLVPKSLELRGDIQVRLVNQNRALELRDTIAVAQDNVPENWVRKLVQLPDPMFRFRLMFQYFPPPLTLAVDDTAPFSFSFICPWDVPVSDHSIHFFTPPDYKITLQNESRPLWESFRELRRLPSNATETFRSAQAPQKIALFISASEKGVSGTTVVERAWLQTWLTGSLRVDWAMYLVKTAHNAVVIQLPPEAMREYQITVRVDGQPVPQPNISQSGMLTIPVAPEQYNRPIEIFIDYRYAFEISGIEVPITLPHFTKDTVVQHQFWQVILKQDRHIIGCPDGWTLEYNWNWNGLFWWRMPSLRKSDIGFDSEKTEPEPSSSGSSQYVFSHLQAPSHVTLYIVDRSLIILCASGTSLFIGLVLIYVPQSRYVGSLFGLGIALLAALFYQPPLVLLMLQAAVFGVFLALGAGYVYRIFHHQNQWVPPAFAMAGDMSQPYLTPLPPSMTVHEVVMDEESDDTEAPSVIHNGQS